MSPSSIVKKLWNFACLTLFSADKYCNVLPACRLPVSRQTGALFGAGWRDDLSACDLPPLQQAGAQAGGMRCDYPSAKLRAGVEQLTNLLFIKMDDERAKPPYLPAWRMYSVLGRMQHHPCS